MDFSKQASQNVSITNYYSVSQNLEYRTWNKHYLITKILLFYYSSYNLIHKLFFLDAFNHLGANGNEFADFLPKVVFRSEQQPRHKIKVKQIEKSLSFLETKSLIHVYCTEK